MRCPPQQWQQRSTSSAPAEDEQQTKQQQPTSARNRRKWSFWCSTCTQLRQNHLRELAQLEARPALY